MNKKSIYKQYFTPNKLANYMVNIIPSNAVSNIIDLSMGECGLLEEAKKRWNNATYFGVDIDSDLIKKIHNRSPYINTYCCDSLSDKLDNWGKYHKVVCNNKFDLALANPPFNYRKQSVCFVGDRNKFSLPVEMVFFLKYIDIIRPGGYICIILPYGFLSLESYAEFRIEILKKVTFLKVSKIFDKCFDQIDAETCLLLMQKKMCNDNKIQNEIELSYIDENFNEIKQHKIKYNSIKPLRLDLEYHHSMSFFSSYENKLCYRIVELSSFIRECKRGKSLTKKKELIVERGTRFVHTTELKQLVISNSSVTHVNAKNDYFKTAVTDINDILIGRVGSACIGKVAIVYRKYPKLIISDCIFKLRVEGIDPYYLTLYLSSKYGQTQIKGVSRGSCSKYLTITDIYNIKVIIPDYSEQLMFRLKYIDILSKAGYHTENKIILLKGLVQELEEFLERSN
ncbi:N-6 DNA methylase [[Clostridium] polysaccharolyticum]|uniref:Type I restriction modification DNA specificity domain-containing protein n=1 Tax=[Clostridium] polysaccharolyticum TaxID=29364 RepID=A0A1I0F9Z5_9FIRM|nr:N-6 DNA methylase [[Clostridium] polysaccharolyticum]SET54751.1 Type I restriction modification DNA specificity domain-containing protein [[Clostridium] polysaccharolyticum]